MKKGDISLIVIVVITFLVLWLIPKTSGTTVRISVNGEIYKEVPLNKDAKIVVESEFGKNTVVIRKGVVYINDSDCSNKLCEDSAASRAGESIVCLPNRLSVTIENEEEQEVDVIL